MITFTSKTEAAAREAYKAAAKGDMERLYELAAHTFNLEDCDEEGNSVLHYAVQGGNMEMIRFLTEQGGIKPCLGKPEDGNSLRSGPSAVAGRGKHL